MTSTLNLFMCSYSTTDVSIISLFRSELPIYYLSIYCYLILCLFIHTSLSIYTSIYPSRFSICLKIDLYQSLSLSLSPSLFPSLYIYLPIDFTLPSIYYLPISRLQCYLCEFITNRMASSFT